MLFSLPPSLLGLVLCVLEARTAAAYPGFGPSVSASSQNIGQYIASGLGGSASPTPTSSNETTLVAATTGTGLAYASSCNSALSSWSLASLNWQYDKGIDETTTFSSAITQTLQEPGKTTVTSVITLCDGYPRVVGRTTTSQGANYTTTASWTNTYVSTETPLQPFPTPLPCSIQANDCKALSSSWDSSLSAAGMMTGAPPACSTTSYKPTSYSSNAKGQECNNCQVVAHTARLMYWPVTTVAGSGNLCNKTASTITAAPSGTPRSFVTEGITITSPTVAISFGGMSRADDCGRTINHTIIPVRPEEVTSVRGFRALFSHYKFNFADLNYRCMGTNTTNYTIADGGGDDCYQEVPAEAYFGGLNNAVVYDQYVFRTLVKSQMTIWEDYQPQILPPNTMSSAIASIWGEGCNIHPDGVWDPPIALQPQATINGPSYGPGETTSEGMPAATTPATPAFPYAPQGPKQTGIRGPSKSPYEEHFTGATALPDRTEGADDGQGGVASTTVPALPQFTTHENPAPSLTKAGGSGHGHYVINGVTCSVLTSTNGVQVLGDADTTFTVTSGATPITVLTTVIVAAAPSGGLVVGTGSEASTVMVSPVNEGSDNGAGTTVVATSYAESTTTITVGGKTLTFSRGIDGAWVIPDATRTVTASIDGPVVTVDAVTSMASPGGPAATADAVTLTAASTGLVRLDASQSVGVTGSTSSAGGAAATATGSSAGSGSSTQATPSVQTGNVASKNGISALGFGLGMLGLHLL